MLIFIYSFCHTFIHLLILPLRENWGRPVHGLLKQLSFFSINTKPFCFFVAILKLLRRDICRTFPGNRKIFAQHFLKVVKVSLEERSLVWYYGSLVTWRNIWIGKNKLTNKIPGSLLYNRCHQTYLNYLKYIWKSDLWFDVIKLWSTAATSEWAKNKLTKTTPGYVTLVIKSLKRKSWWCSRDLWFYIMFFDGQCRKICLIKKFKCSFKG